MFTIQTAQTEFDDFGCWVRDSMTGISFLLYQNDESHDHIGISELEEKLMFITKTLLEKNKGQSIMFSPSGVPAGWLPGDVFRRAFEENGPKMFSGCTIQEHRLSALEYLEEVLYNFREDKAAPFLVATIGQEMVEKLLDLFEVPADGFKNFGPYEGLYITWLSNQLQVERFTVRYPETGL